MASDQTATVKRRRKLKVYGGNLDGRHRVILACYSYKEFQAVTRVGRDYGCETGNADEIAQAMSDPGTSFMRMTTFPLPPWSIHKSKETDDVP